jgi:ABC-type polysaccharide/polyol phosphate transport system ATPase subunit
MDGDPSGRTVIEVRGLHKRFRMPARRPDTLKERAVHPFRRQNDRMLKVLDGISFDVKQGEFFGIVGRNGAGKSTLLKLLASIYRADGGTIRMAGRVASVIELGVGFQPELAAEENVVLNCMMMGMTARQARDRLDAVLDFADLHDFVDLKLKNYSSGMRVRLAFATMLQSDPDILLLDEVLAVGDPPFQRKCQEAFRELRSMNHKTIILVSNQLDTIRKYCSRVMVLESAKITRIGPPDVVAGDPISPDSSARSAGDQQTRTMKAPGRAVIDEVQLASAGGPVNGGSGTGFLETAELIRLRVSVQAREEILRPGLRMQIRDETNATVFFPPSVELAETGLLSPANPISIEAEIENRLTPGRYFAFCALTDHSGAAPDDVSEPAHVEFVVGEPGVPEQGAVNLEHRVRVVEPAPGAQRDRSSPDRLPR